ncbi:arsenate reductase (azurin) large subunit [Hyalangium sp.]|uniref:arsenate reductase (azurin) large subunit n=1 Tax=Hyalangium sp. TaxID=2028555 RepID=UPI002D488C64|nr:arsenate reductase (azurin) large subunit [Hyalangium sp.]HYH95637.1 arsenate reductase (azurin) large subunit [Hyalangium sp.]
MSVYERRDSLPIPPKDAKAQNTVCQYCTVGCGYVVYTWPVGKSGGLSPEKNAFGVDLSQPQVALEGLCYTESMHALIQSANGQHMNVAIVPAADSPINLKRDHSSRGATNALTTYSGARPTRERLKTPLLRVGKALVPISWEEAVAVLAGVIQGVSDKFGPDALCAKATDHGGGGGGFENNYAIGKLFFTGLQMKNVAIHNRPAYNSEVWGSRDRGVHELHYTAEDARLCDTLVLWGANSYETASVFYTEHMLPNFQSQTQAEKKKVFSAGEPLEPMRMIVVDPRKTSSVAIPQSLAAERVLHLRPNLGTDVVLTNAVARVIWEKGYADRSMIDQRSDTTTFADYQAKSLMTETAYAAFLAEAEKITGVPRADIEKAAEWMAKPKSDKFRRRSLIIYEKGMIWNQRNYDTIAALVQMAVLGGNIGREGTGCGRQGGHQEGYVRPGYPGVRPPPNVDKYLMEGNGKFYWVIGTNPYLTTPRSQQFRKSINARTSALTRAIASAVKSTAPAKRVEQVLSALASSSGLFMVVSDLYLTETARDAHLVLPAAGWGEMNLTSINCNSRLLRLYERFMDPPGQAKPDWEILALTARKLEEAYTKAGKAEQAKQFSGFSWKTDEEVFQAGAQEFPDNTLDEKGAESLPCETYKGVTYALLRSLGQKGIQTPVRKDPATGALVGTPRRYGKRFGTPDGKFKWYGTDPWSGFPAEVAKYFQGGKEKTYTFWLTTGRNQHIWQTGYHDQHIAQKMAAVPLPYVEIHPEDAKKLGVKAGDMVEVYNEEGSSNFQVHVTDAPKPGLIFALQYHPRGTANHLTSPYTDAKTTIPWYKGTRVAVRKAPSPATKVPATSPLAGNHFR